MATVSGRVIFDLDRSATITAGDTGMQNVPVVLQNTTTGQLLTVLTDVNGNYSFINVPDGSYRLVEAYGTAGGVPTPGNFTTAIVGPVPVGEDPPISFATNPPAGATNLDSLSPNTLFITVAGADVTNQYFFDGPIIYTPIQAILDPCTTVSSTNLITAADNGTFGTWPAGTAVETGPAVNPYPGIAPGFIYAVPVSGSSIPLDGYYTIQNILTNTTYNSFNQWWRVADHTSGDETGRFQVINGANPNTAFFQQTVAVTPNTNYLFTTWILNLIKQTVGYVPPQLGVEILDQNNNIIYQQTLGNSIPANPVQPEWKEIGTALNSGSNTSLTVVFLSQGLAATGNDFAIDDVALNPVSIPDFVPVKSVDKPYATVGDIVTYTVTLTNTCNNPLTNVFFQDTIPTGLSFVGGSVTVNGVGNGALDPQAGFTVPDIAGGATATITFKAQVNSIPTPNPTNNTATMDYQYTPVTGGIPNQFTQNSNIVPVQVNQADLIGVNSANFVKSVDKAFADIGDTLTYSFTIKNTGNTTATNIILTDPIPNGTSFVVGSTLVNGLPSGDNPVTGINIPSIPAGGSATVSFKVTVNSIPTPNPIPDTGTLNYKYIVDPNQAPVSASGNSNTVFTQVNHADLIGTNSANFVKSVDKAYANVGDILTYSFTIKNTGNVAATNIVLTDPIPNDTTFVLGSVIVNGGATGDSPATGINIPSIPAGGSATVSFQVTVDRIPTPNPIPDTGALTYQYLVDPQQPPVSVSGNSNTVTTQVNNANLTIVKSANKAYAEVGSTITYTYTITNTGNTTATNVLLTDALPNGTSFVAGSTLVNGLPSTDSPVTGINVPNVLPGATATVSFQVLVNQLPVPNPTVNIGNISYKYIVDPNQPPVTGGGTSNQVKVQIEEVNIQVVKTVDKTNVIPGEVVTYTTVISNSGTVTAQNVIFTDPIPAGTTFVTDSVTVNGVPKIGANPATGINVGNIPPGGSVTITFKVTVNSPATVTQITNKSSIKYQVQIDPNGPLDNRTGNSNTTTSNVQKGELTVVKIVDQKITNVGSTLTYTIVVTNTGTVPVQNVVLTDTIPIGVTFVQNSVMVNGVQVPGADPSVGIPLGTLAVGGQAVVTFQVLVASIPCPPELINEAVVNFQFNLPNRTETFTGTNTSNGTSTDVGLMSFKQISVDENLTIPSQKPDAEDVLDATVSVSITRIEVIKTPIGESYEGQTLTGWKAIIYGKLSQKVKYVADEPTQSVHAAHFDIPFTTFIVLPSDFKKCCPIRIQSTVEDIYVQLLDKRTIFKNVTLLIEGKLCS